MSCSCPAPPLSLSQVLLTHEEADAHDALPSLEQLRQQDPAFCARVERALTKARNEHYY